VFALSGLGVNIAQASANATWDPFVAFAQNLTGEGVQVQGATTVPFNSWYEWYKSQPVYPVGGNEELGSRLLTRDVLEGNYEGLAETFVERGLNGGLLCVFRISIFFLPPSPSSFSSSFFLSLNINLLLTLMTADRLIGGGAVSKIDPESTGVTPAWRSALAHALFAETWAEGTSLADIEAKRDRMKGNIRAMEAQAPGSGSYLNEVRLRDFIFDEDVDVGYKASLYEENPRETFFGSHYDRLKKIKDKYDPDQMFVVAEGVGSDEWDESLNCRR